MSTWTSSSSVGVIGAGRLGSALALSALKAGYQVVAVSSASQRHAEELCTRLQVGGAATVAASVREVCERAQLIVLAVPDAAIAAVCATLPLRAGQAVVHCSGAVGLEALSTARERGALVGCMHPLQTFPSRLDSDRFEGIYCGVEADAELEAWLITLCEKLGATTFSLTHVDRARYHAAAVLTSNYVVALHAAAARLFASIGLSAELARNALAPLTLASAQGLRALPLAQALTGPIARGDVETVRQHQSALASDTELLTLYRQLGRFLLELDLGLTPEQLEALRKLLSPQAP